MRRRDFIALLGGSAATWPLGVRAQQAATPVIGFLHAATSAGYASMTATFIKAVADGGYPNVMIEYRWAEGHLDRLPDLALDLVNRQVSLIFAGGGPDAVIAAKKASSTIPIVFANATDPVAIGLVASLDRPGGNVTGVTYLINTLAPKEFEVLDVLAPKGATIGVLLNRSDAVAAAQLRDLQDAASSLGRQIQIFHAITEHDIDTIYASLVQIKAGGLVVGADAFFFARREQFVDLAARNSIPTIYPWREAVVAGGLASYGASVTDGYRLAGTYTARILKVEKPANLPVQQSTKVELTINLKTAKSLGLTMPLSLLGRADEVIE